MRKTKSITVALAVAAGLQYSIALPAGAQGSAGDLRYDSGFGSNQVDADNYLHIMKKLIHGFNDTVSASVLAPGGANTDPAAMSAGAQRTSQLADEIRAVKAPPEVAAQHAQLSKMLASVQNYLALGGASEQGMGKAMDLTTQLHSTMNNYHQAVLQMIAKRGLSSDLDPFAGESEDKKLQALQGIEQLKQQGTPGLGGSPFGAMPAPGGELGTMGDIMNGAAGASGTGGGAGLGGMDFGALMQGLQGLPGMMGGAGGAGGAGSDGGAQLPAGMDMNTIMQGMQSLLGGLGGAAQSGGSLPGAGSLPLGGVAVPPPTDPVGAPDPSMGGMPGPPSH